MGRGTLHSQDYSHQHRYLALPKTSSVRALTPGRIAVGDLMQYWTNNLYRSTLHRVGIPPDRTKWKQGRALRCCVVWHAR